MSNPYVTGTIIAALIAIIFFQGWMIARDTRKRKKISTAWREALDRVEHWKAIANGAHLHDAQGWREIAFHHAREKKAEAKRTKFFEDSCGRLLTENQDWAAQFRHLVVFLWGDPPLDRTIFDVCNVIAELRASVAKKAETAEAISQAYQVRDRAAQEVQARLIAAGAELETRSSELAAAVQSLAELRQNFDWLVSNGMGVIVEGQRLMIMPVQTTGTPLAIGLNIAEMIEEAKLALRRQQEGLSS